MNQIDRLAIIATAVIVLGLLSAALLMEDAGAKNVEKITRARDAINDIASRQKVRRESPPRVQDQVGEQYSGTRIDEMASWCFYRRPGILDIEVSAPEVDPVHERSRLARVQPYHDAGRRRPAFTVSGRLGKLEYAEYVEAVVEISEGDSGVWRTAAAIPTESPEFEIEIMDGVEPGRPYRFRLRTVARSTSKNQLAPEVAQLYSRETSDTVRLPYEWGFRATMLKTASFTTEGPQPGSAMIYYEFWDYDDDKAVKDNKHIPEGEPGKRARELSPLWDTKWVLFRVDRRKRNPDDSREIEVAVLKHQETRDTLLLWKGDPMPDVESGVGWEAPPEATEGAASEAGESSASEPEKPTTPPAGGGGFGDDDDDDF